MHAESLRRGFNPARRDLGTFPVLYQAPGAATAYLEPVPGTLGGLSGGTRSRPDLAISAISGLLFPEGFPEPGTWNRQPEKGCRDRYPAGVPGTGSRNRVRDRAAKGNLSALSA